MRRETSLTPPWLQMSISCGLAFLLCIFVAGPVAAEPSLQDLSAWTAAHDLREAPQTAAGRTWTLTGSDPQLLGPALPEAAEGEMWFEAELEADAAGAWQLFFTDPAAEARSLRFAIPAGRATEIRFPLPAIAAGTRLRLDPPGTAKRVRVGEIHCIPFRPGDGPTVKLRGPSGKVHDELEISLSAALLSRLPQLPGAVCEIHEIPLWETSRQARAKPPLAVLSAAAPTVLVPRLFEGKDRRYARFLATTSAVAGRVPLGVPQGVTSLEFSAPEQAALPPAASKKGLQVQMLDDALALGIKHATLNVDLSRLFDPAAAARLPATWSPGEPVPLALDRAPRKAIRELTAGGVNVYLILLVQPTGRPEIDRVLLPPEYVAGNEPRPAAWNLSSPRAVAWYAAVLEGLAERFSGPAADDARTGGWIVGNEVNSHSAWHRQGPAGAVQVAARYERECRLAQTALRRHSRHARIYMSLDHFWTHRMSTDPLQSCGGRELLENVAYQARGAGDFARHVAHHPYPEDLFKPAFWKDRTAPPSVDAPRITFRNLEQLTQFLDRPLFHFLGQPPRVILSEQGFHAGDGPEAENLQAAAYCAAYRKVESLPGIDAFILHRHVDHAHEGGLRLGLWTHRPGTIADPDRKRPLYDVFRAADTPDWETAFRFALPLVGRTDWNEPSPQK